MITIKPYRDKYVIENQQEINQYHKNLLKDQKECHTSYLPNHQTINIDNNTNANHKS